MFGLFEGKKLEILLKKKEFMPGETISGILKLKLKEPMHGILKVFLTYDVPNEDYSVAIEKTFVSFDFGTREYSTSEYSFALEIPAEPPEIKFPVSSDGDTTLIENWKNDDVLGTNAFTINAVFETPDSKPLEKYLYIKIKYQ